MKRYDISAAEGIYLGTIDIEEEQYGKWVKWEEAKQVIDALEAKIDALMLEHCPDEMTPEQVENWEKHQRLSTSMDEGNS